MPRWKKVVRILLISGGVLVVTGLSLVYAIYHGYILPNRSSASQYPIRGVDVSHYQGEIDWPVLAGNDIQFAFIKATEGSSHVDPKFRYNWEQAQGTDLEIGAYHFFSFDSPAETQLANFTAQVTAFDGMLPPVVDFEFYADKKVNPPDAEPLREQLRAFLNGLEGYYHMRPVIYATEDTWEMYLEGYFEDYPLWIRNVVSMPKISGIMTFWQYSNRGRLEGYSGEEEYIDLNVFCGSEKEWETWVYYSTQGYHYTIGWGSYTPFDTYSYDGKYLACQDVVTPYETRYVQVTIYDTETGLQVEQFYTQRARDFHGICWDSGTYNIWSNSGDVGTERFEFSDGKWGNREFMIPPKTIISQYAGVPEQNDNKKINENKRR